MKKRTIWTILILFGLSWLVRAAFLVLITGGDAPLTGDQPSYHKIAISFLQGEGLRDGNLRSYRPPLISLQLAGLYSLAGPDPGLARWYMVFVSALVASLLFLVARTLWGKHRIATFTGITWCFYPPSIFCASKVLTENMAELLTVLYLGSMIWTTKIRHRLWAAAIAGIIWGLMALNRPNYLFLPFALLGVQAALRRHLSWSWSRQQWLLGLAAFVATMAPWMIRNYQIHGVFMPTTSMGYRLLVACNANLTRPEIQAGMYWRGPEDKYLLSEPEARWGAIAIPMTINHVLKNLPSLFLPLLNRAKNFWTPEPFPYDSSGVFWYYEWLMYIIWIPALILFVVSFRWLSWRQDWPALALILYAFLFTLPFWGTPRCRFPVDLLIISRAMISLEVFLTWVRERTGFATPTLSRLDRDAGNARL